MSEKEEETKEAIGDEVLAIAVIGSAGRGDDSRKFFPGLFEEMVKRVSRTIRQVSRTIKPHHTKKKIRLVSGGAAWADHVAVALFLDGVVDELRLYFPTDFCKPKTMFSTGSLEGPYVNRLHRAFAQVSGVDSLGDIGRAIKMPGCRYFVHDGFFARNTKIAQSADCVIALTWSRDNKPPPGGTRDTWEKSQSRHKIHIALSSLMVPRHSGSILVS